MDAYPPTISTQQPGADSAQDGSGSSDVAVSHTCLKQVNAPLSTLRIGEVKSKHNGTTSTVKLNKKL